MMEEDSSIKATPTHTETIEKPQVEHALTNEIHGFEIDYESLPKGYYRSRFFIGTMLATGLALICGTAAFGFAAPILSVINADLGPDNRYTWISLVYNAVLAVFLSPVGRLSDIFGRRWFFIGGALVAVLGSIVCATATNILTLVKTTTMSHNFQYADNFRLVEMYFWPLQRMTEVPP
jgi:hypothetical protein